MKISNKLWRKALLPITAGVILLESASAYAARCEYVIQSDWNSGFVAAIRITNDTNTAINGWSVNWSYSDGSKRTGGWNANFSGNNPYSATNVGWNGQINPGQTAEFGIQGNKGIPNAPAAKPTVTGAVCSGSTSSVSSVRSSSSSVSSSSLVRSSSVSLPQSSSNNTFSSARSNSGASSAWPLSSSSQGSVVGVSSSRASLPTSAARSSSSFALSSLSSSRSLSSDVSSRAISSIDVSSYSSSSSHISSNSISSFSSSTRSSSSSSMSSSLRSSSSSYGPSLPEVDLQVSVHGMTVHVDLRGSTDINGDMLSYRVDFGDDEKIAYPNVWHTYREPGTYIIEAWVYESGNPQLSVKTYPVTVGAAVGNQAPVARFTARRYQQDIEVVGTPSFDLEGMPLTYEWDFGFGPFVDGAYAHITDCDIGEDRYKSIWVTLTVSDGQLKDTVQIPQGGPCGTIGDFLLTSSFAYQVQGNTLMVDGSNSRGNVGFNWDFGDGTSGTGVVTSHTYASPGTYDVRLSVPNSVGGYEDVTNQIGVGVSSNSSSSVSPTSSSHVSSPYRSSSSAISSSRSSSSHVSSPYRSSSSFMTSSTSSRAFDSAASIPSSSARSSSSQRSSDRNLYIAPRATTAPVIDGVVDSVWEKASWAPINVFWLGTQSNPSAQDYSGRYKALWDENYLYVLYDITDDRIYDGVRDALDRYWEDDTVELFIDENKSGGQHGYNTSAWAYHISTYGDVVDSTTGSAKLLNDHIDSRLVSNGTQHYWEMRIRIYGEDYADWKSNTPLTLSAGKLMGFSACYIDNDGSSQRESMMGSVDTQGHKNNQGYLDASVFGSILLVE